MSVLSLWGFWVAFVALICVVGVAPLIGGLTWTMNHFESVMAPIAWATLFILVWLPAMLVGIGYVMAPWAHSLGLDW